MNRNILLMGVCLLCSCLGASGQQQLTLSVSDMYALADSTDLGIRSARYAVMAAQSSLDAAKNQKLPELSVSASVSYNGDGYVWDRDFQNGMVADIPHFGNNFSAEASQVIFAGGALNASEELARESVAASEADLEQKRLDVYFILTGFLLDIAKTDESIVVFDKNIELSKQIIGNLKSRLETGSALTNDITRYQLYIDRLELQRQRLVNIRTILNNELTTVLKLNQDVKIIPSLNLDQNNPTLDYQNSPTIKKSSLFISMGESKEKLAKSDMLPQIALVGSANLDGPVLIEVPVLNKNFFYWYVGVGLRYNFSSLYKSKARYQSARHATKEAVLNHEKADEEISKAVFAANVHFKEAENEIEVAANSLKLANDNYQIISQRYDNGLSLLTDMLDASNMILQSELDLHSAQITRLYRYYELLHISGNLSK